MTSATIRGHLTRTRVTHAAPLLAEGDLKVAAIAAAAGVSGPAQLHRAFRRTLGTTPQEGHPRGGRRKHGPARRAGRGPARGHLAEFGLEHLRRQRADTLSGGERRRLEIARALVTRPSFLLLDEPFAGIDPITVLDIQNLIKHLRDRGYGILITDHNVRDTLKITDRASIIKDGKVFASGDPPSLAEDPLVRQVYLGDGFQL